jgi:hypothetical protein
MAARFLGLLSENGIFVREGRNRERGGLLGKDLSSMWDWSWERGSGDGKVRLETR